MKDSRLDTFEHKYNVSRALNKIISELQERSLVHDNSKLEDPELSGFNSTCNLSELKYPSPEYDESKRQLGKALEHHYAVNRHHPEHFPNGIRDMSLVDIIEMFCDWKAATLRQNDGNIKKSIQANQDRFKYSDELKSIFMNTINVVE